MFIINEPIQVLPPTDQHVGVSVVSDREQMGRHLSTTLSTVLVDNVLGVDRQTTVGVDDNTEQTRVSLQGIDA